MNIPSSFKIAPASFLFFLTLPLPGAIITEITWTDLNGTHTSSSGDGTTNADTDINEASTLDSFTVGGTSFSSFITATSASASGASGVTPYWGSQATNLTAADDLLSVTDNRIDTGMVNMGNDSDFFFSSTPLSLDDMLFIFDVGSSDGDIFIELYDSSNALLGTGVTENFDGSSIADMDFDRMNGGSVVLGGSNVNFVGRAITFADFGLSAAELSQIDKVRIDGKGVFDPSMIGIALVPEPSSALLSTLSLGLLALRRPRQ